MSSFAGSNPLSAFKWYALTVTVAPSSSVAACLLGLLTACGGRSQSSSAPSDCPEGDRDGDCQASLAEGGPDCDDSDPTVHAGAPDNGPGSTFHQQIINDWQALPHPFCLTMDRYGALHLLGGDGMGFYTTDRSGAWQTFALEQDPPKGYCNLFVDGEGLHLVYSDGTYEPPTSYAHHPGAQDPGAAFSHEVVTNDGRVQTWDIWRSLGGRTYIAYLSDASGVWVTERKDGGWVEELVGDLGGWGSLELSGSDEGEPWLLTNRLRDIYSEPFFSARSGGVWTDQKLAEGATSFMELALAEHHQGVPELAFQYSRHGNYGPPGRFSRIEQRTAQNGSFAGTVVDEQFWPDCMSIATVNGIVRLALVGHGEQTEGSARELRVYERRDGSWKRSTREEIDHARALASCWLFFDASGALTTVLANDDEQLVQTHNRSAPDGIDQNCDGVDGVDADGDGIASRVTGGTDDDE